jgi:PTS system fructose-specific IIC component
MKITELLKRDTIILDIKARTKRDVINELVEKPHSTGRLQDKEKFTEAILAREAQSTTGIGEGIAIPHAKTNAVKVPAIAFGRSKEGVDYEALDGQSSHLFFMIAANEGANNEHLETLSRLSSFLMDPAFRLKIESASKADEVLHAIDEKELSEATDEHPVAQGSNLVLAVTACPTGIAHTYMAADSLKAKAKELGVDIKVQTNGSSGVKNKLTPEEIEKASAIIVAADTQVDLTPFNGKPVIHGTGGSSD